MNHKEYIDSIFESDLTKEDVARMGREPDCYIVAKTTEFGSVVGTPLAIFKNKQSLYDKFEKICNDTDGRFGISVVTYYFDD